MKKKKKKSKFKYNVNYMQDGEPFWIKDHHFITCCDCGLTHHVIVDKEIKKGKKKSMVAPNDVWLSVRVYRDDYTTERERKNLGVVLKKKRR